MSVLPDVLRPGLVTVLCGSAAGAVSARRGLPYAGPGNMFWPTLAATGLTPRALAPAEFRTLPDFAIGLTDLNKTESGADSDLSAAGDDPAGLIEKIETVRPKILAFTAKRPAAVVLKHRFGLTGISYGLQDALIGGAAIFVLPSPSGLAVRWWDADHWHALAALHRTLSATTG